MDDFELYMREARGLVEDALEQVLPVEETRPSGLHRAMRYSVLGGGKRLRAILCMAACQAVGGEQQDALLPGAAVEILHAYTLVHDDLPAMDDDDLRRGKPSTHKAFGEAEAILAGDALLTFAFEMLANTKSSHACQMVSELARAAGHCGVIGGQYEDVSSSTASDDTDKLEFIHIHKTADLTSATCKLGGLAGNGGSDQLAALAKYGTEIGLAFQFVDDILDETGSAESLGKPVGSDRESSKMTAVSLYGVEETRKRARDLVDSAVAQLERLPGPTMPLRGIAELILTREN